MTAEGRNEGLCDLSNVVAFGHNEQWRPKAAKVVTKLDKNLPNGNTATVWSNMLQSAPLHATPLHATRATHPCDTARISHHIHITSHTISVTLYSYII